MIYTGTWFYIGIGEHSFDVLSVYFNDKVADTYEIKVLWVECMIKMVKFKFWLWEMHFSVIQGNRAESSIVALVRVITVALAKVETDNYVGVDSNGVRTLSP